MTNSASTPSAAGVTTGGARMGLGLFLVSAAVLAMQVLQTRILSVMMWHHHSYMVVTMTLLGFAVAGSLVTIRPRLLEGDVRPRLAWCSSLFCLSTFAVYLLLSVTADRATEMTERGSFLLLSIFYAYLFIPYLFAGLVVTIALSAGERVHKLYFVNLLGSALGAWVFILTIRELGAERLLVVCAATGPVAALSFLGFRGPLCAARITSLGALLLCGGLFLTGDAWLEISVASNKAMVQDMARTPGAEHVDQRWSPLCRLDLVRMPGEDAAINIYQDGDAITVMHSDASFAQQDPGALNVWAYEARRFDRDAAEAEPPRSLAIGIGGGIDLRYGLAQGVEKVLGIEINPVTVELVGTDWADFNGDVYHREGAEVRVGEGRSTLRRLDERFDVIELSGTDTYTAGNAGAYVLSESYLYTQQALEEYFEHLAPGGTLGMIRLAYDPPRENLRLFAIALSVLRDRFGVTRPSEHALVIFNEVYYEEIDEWIRFSVCVFSKDPFGPGLRTAAHSLSMEPHSEYRLMYAPGQVEAFGEAGENEFTRLAAALDAGEEQAFYDAYRWNVRPVSDDSPFFFNFHPWSWSYMWTGLVGGADRGATGWHENTGGPVGMQILGALLSMTTLLTAVLVLLPLVFLRRGGLQARSAGRHLTYFLGLGAGFMFLEISTIQRLVLYLGHPTYSLTVTLFCFLFFAGLGSQVSGRWFARPGRALRAVVGLLCLLVLAQVFLLDGLLDATLHLSLPMRVGVVALVLAPMNFLMGMPFPLGLGRLKRLEPRLVPWALGANGAASVVASILVIVLAMQTGFRTVAILAALIYAVGVVAFTTGPLSPGRTDG